MSTTKLASVANELTDQFVKNLQEQIAKQVAADVAQKLAQIDIHAAMQFYVDRKLSDYAKNMSFPDGSIPSAAVDLSKFVISGDHVVGGIIRNFGSVGIQDSATKCQMTILDDATVIENKFVAMAATIKGDLTVEGDLKLIGEIPTDSPFYRDMVEHAAGLLNLSMDGEFFLKYADKVFDKIKTDGIDLSKVTINGREFLEGNKLGNFVTETNIQKLGELRKLTVLGETSLNNGTFNAVNQRVGINTAEPAAALSVWDEECEILVRKFRKDVSMIGSTRNQRVVLSSNNKNNIVLETDGSVSIEKLTVGAVLMASAEEMPRYEAKQGSIIFNEKPAFGKAVGWVCIGGANWASFGTVN